MDRVSDQLRIIAAGTTGSGKSTLAKTIQSALEKYAIKATIVDDEPTLGMNEEAQQEMRIAAMRQGQRDIVIETRQAARHGHTTTN